MHALEWAFVVKIRKLGGGFIEDRKGKLSGFQSLKRRVFCLCLQSPAVRLGE